MTTLNLVNVSKHYGKQIILEDINLHINKGEFVVIVGPSGSGKSTLLRLVAGLDELNHGKILLNNLCVNKIPPAARDMAMVFQHYALYPHMTVYDNMAYGLKMRRLKRPLIREKVTEVAKILQISEFLERKPSSLSGGQRQRVAIGRAMVRSPAVFLFDEPLSNLDAKLRAEMRHEIKRLHQAFQITSIYVTHDQTEAMTLADKIVILNQGKIEQVATPQIAYQKPATIFVASFIGFYPMNFLKAVVNLSKKTIDCEEGISLPWPVFEESKFHLRHNEPVLVSTRPEDCHLIEDLEQDNCIKGLVEFIDDMGSDKLIQIRSEIGNTTFQLCTKKDLTYQIPKLAFQLDIRKANIFCPSSGLRIGSWDG